MSEVLHRRVEGVCLGKLAELHVNALRRQCRESTTRKAEYLLRTGVLKYFGSDREVDSIRRFEAQEWVDEPEQARRPAQTRNMVSAARAACNRGIRLELIERNSFKAVEIPAAPVRGVVLTDSQIVDVLARLATDEVMSSPERRQAGRVIRFLVLTGARRGEILYLDWREVDLSAGVIVLQPERHKTGNRTGKPKVIYLPPAAVEFLCDMGPKDAGRVFRCSYATLRRTFERMRREIGAPNITMHDLRRTYSTLLAEAGVDVADVAAVLGQASVAVAQRHYRHLRPARLKELAALAGSLMTRKGDVYESA